MALINTIKLYNDYAVNGAGKLLSDADFVAQAYVNLLNLKGSFTNAAGRKQYWVDKLKSGALTKANFAEVFFNQKDTHSVLFKQTIWQRLHIDH